MKNRGKQAEIAKKSGRSRALISRKAKQGKLVEANGEIDVDASVAAVLQRSKASEESYASAQRRKEIYLADLRQLELQQKRGQLVHIKDVEIVWDRLTAVCRSKLLAIPARIGPVVFAATAVEDVRDIIEKEIHAALLELASRGLDAVLPDDELTGKAEAEDYNTAGGQQL